MLKQNREPLITAATVVAIFAAGLQVLVVFGLGLEPEQIKALMGLVTVTAPLVVAWWARRKVTPIADPRTNTGERLVAEYAKKNS